MIIRRYKLDFMGLRNDYKEGINLKMSGLNLMAIKL